MMSEGLRETGGQEADAIRQEIRDLQTIISVQYHQLGNAEQAILDARTQMEILSRGLERLINLLEKTNG